MLINTAGCKTDLLRVAMTIHGGHIDPVGEFCG